MTKNKYLHHAISLCRETLLIDTHIDLPYRYELQGIEPNDNYINTPIQNPAGDFDYVRAKQGGLNAAFIALFVPPEKQNKNDAQSYAKGLLNVIDWIVAAHPDKFIICQNEKEIHDAVKNTQFAICLGLENAAAIWDWDDLDFYYKKGVRYITLCHKKNNHICDSSDDDTPVHGGLSRFGRNLIREMNKRGIFVDVSHISDEAFYETLSASRRPVLASHSACRHFTPGWKRNMSDDMIIELARHGGLIHVNFGSMFLANKYQGPREKLWSSFEASLKKKGLQKFDPEAIQLRQKFIDQYSGDLYGDISMVADQFDHIIQLVGIQHVGIGSDFDGVGDALPVGLKDVSMYPHLIAELLQRGHSENDMEKVMHKNFFDFWRKVQLPLQNQEG